MDKRNVTGNVYILLSFAVVFILGVILPLIPTQDGAAHFYTAFVLDNLKHSDLFSRCLTLNRSLTSNWVITLLITGFLRLFPLRLANNLFLSFLLILNVWVYWKFLLKNGLSNSVAVPLAFVLSLNAYLFWGFYSFYLGTFIFIGIVLLMGYNDRLDIKQLAFAFFLTLILFFMHTFYFVQALLLWLYYLIDKVSRKLRTHVILFSYIGTIFILLLIHYGNLWDKVVWVYNIFDRIKIFLKSVYVFPWSGWNRFYILALLFLPLGTLWSVCLYKNREWNRLIYLAIMNFLLYFFTFDLLGEGSHIQIRFMFVAVILLTPYSAKYLLKNWGKRGTFLFISVILLIQLLVIVKEEVFYSRKVNELITSIETLTPSGVLLYRNYYVERDGSVNPLKHAALYGCITMGHFCPQDIDLWVNTLTDSPQKWTIFTGRYPVSFNKNCEYVRLTNSENQRTFDVDSLKFDYLVLYGKRLKYKAYSNENLKCVSRYDWILTCRNKPRVIK